MLSDKTCIVIVDDNIDFTYILSEYLSSLDDFDIVGTANNGNAAFELIKEKEPDFVILDIVMPETDGFGVLEKFIHIEKKPQFIVLSAIGQDKIIQLALSLGADFFVLKPFDMDNLVLRIKQLKSIQNTPERLNIIGKDKPEMNTEDKIINIMNDIGMPSHLMGYKYLIFAVKIVLNNLSAINSITKSIYSCIAKEYNTTGQRVERAIRNSIEICWYKGNLDIIDKLFNINERHSRPTNSEFIIVIADKLRKN